MRNHTKQKTGARRPPQLIRTLLDLEKYRGQSFPTARLEEDLVKLSKDRGEVLSALLFAVDLARIPTLAGLKQIQSDALLEASQRTDLTGAEGIRLYQALNKEIEQAERLALQEQERKRQQRR